MPGKYFINGDPKKAECVDPFGIAKKKKGNKLMFSTESN